MILKPRAFWKTSYVIHSGWLRWLGTTHAFVVREAVVHRRMWVLLNTSHQTESPPCQELVV